MGKHDIILGNSRAPIGDVTVQSMVRMLEHDSWQDAAIILMMGRESWRLRPPKMIDRDPGTMILQSSRSHGPDLMLSHLKGIPVLGEPAIHVEVHGMSHKVTQCHWVESGHPRRIVLKMG